jgi:hypothetical protein
MSRDKEKDKQGCQQLVPLFTGSMWTYIRCEKTTTEEWIKESVRKTPARGLIGGHLRPVIYDSSESMGNPGDVLSAVNKRNRGKTQRERSKDT